MIPAPWRYEIRTLDPAGRPFAAFNLAMHNLPHAPEKLNEACDALNAQMQIPIRPSDLCRAIFGKWETFFVFCELCQGDPVRN